jgi:putative ATP-dependent endonuclease of OLD family
LEYKGDGVKSLAALGLLRSKTAFSGASIIAIEEPESHLHPGAMHSLREVLETLTEENQLVITTHCPLFVERGNISRNIIVDSNNAKTSKDISSIRQILGIKASDNLVNASYVLVVEGVEDVIALTSLLPYLSPELSKAMKLHQLVIEQIGGASNLSYKLTQLNNSLCVTHVLLDNDAAGRKAYEKAESEKTIKMADITFLNCPGMPDSEFEDCLDKAVYEQEILSQFGVTLSGPEFRSNKKWSDRVKACFEKQGKPWSSKLEAQVKAVTAEVVAKNPGNALNSHKRSTIDALVTALEQKISKL